MRQAVRGRHRFVLLGVPIGLRGECLEEAVRTRNCARGGSQFGWPFMNRPRGLVPPADAAATHTRPFHVI